MFGPNVLFEGCSFLHVSQNIEFPDYQYGGIRFNQSYNLLMSVFRFNKKSQPSSISWIKVNS